MDIKTLNHRYSISGQLTPADMPLIRALGYRAILCNRPDGEVPDQPDRGAMHAAAEAAGLVFESVTISNSAEVPGARTAMAAALERLPEPILAYCRTGNRSRLLWEAVQGDEQPDATHSVVIIGGGAGGLAAAASLRKRQPELDIAVIEPKRLHDYQPGWTLVGAGVFQPRKTQVAMADVLPRGVTWIQDSVRGIDPDRNRVICAGGKRIGYDALVIAPGIKLDWDAIAGLRDSLGEHGVTSNYLIEHAPYTWQLVQSLKGGRALFTQPAMPIKCAGAPQKAMYLSADYWRRQQCLAGIEVEFFNAGGVLFGVPDYVPALESYVARYGAAVHFNENLTAVDGPGQTATFTNVNDGTTREERFDMLHVCPPQTAPDFIRASALADSAGWLAVDPETLQHPAYPNVFGLGDATSTSNAKTAAAVRKQAPVVAMNLLAQRNEAALPAGYDGYGSCPLTVERGRVVLAEFTYGGKVAPTLPTWILNGTKPTRLGWWIKASFLVPMYFQMMLKGREWLATPKQRTASASERSSAR